MSSRHQEKFLSKILFGFAFIIVGIFFILFASFERAKADDWYLWGIVASLLVCPGIYLIMSGFVHKVKSDFIRRQKQKEQQKTFTADSL
jgi:uncharacterized membrane protein